MSLAPSASVPGSIELPGAVCSISNELDSIETIMKQVADDRCGASTIFIGTTRDSFQGRAVNKLEYQAYTKLALNTFTKIVSEAQNNIFRSEHQVPSQEKPLLRVALHHRIGTVKIGEPSIVIAVSSPHRKEAFLACEFILEEVKRKAQIWKREYYEGEDESEAEWKANA
ncbi:molybdenum cofactor synthesis 2 [Gymnopus androsaceus JB14]|uniref:Molybdenum cofactor synthesis 2 n=1 Tax=Gymnopus androsaceus JB14 TaxID=1447944 RepID=A0A6A4IC08_9AGAR|nr:molybdenum cofactor synthesis 2 [Gymnopus androsaceus JB14]